MTPAGPVLLTAAQVDRLRTVRRDGVEPTGADRDGLVAAGALVGDALHPTVAAAVVVLEAAWATFRVRRWRDGERVDLTGAVGPGGVALLAGPPGPSSPLAVGHRPRWSTTARAIAGFVGLGPAAADPHLPAHAPWAELVAATGPAPPPWLPAADGPPVTLWDLAWEPVGPGAPRRLAAFDRGGAGLVEVRPARGASGPDASDPDGAPAPADEGPGRMTLRPCPPADIWSALCHLVGTVVPGRAAPARPESG